MVPFGDDCDCGAGGGDLVAYAPASMALGNTGYCHARDVSSVGRYDSQWSDRCDVVVCYWALYHQRDGLAGGVIAVATLFKIYPILLLGFFIIKGRWRAVIGFLVGMLVCNGIAIEVMGWDMHRIYLFDVLPNIGGTTSWVENQTIAGFVARWFDVPFDAHIFALHGVSLVAQLCSLLVIAIVCVLALRNEPAQSTRYALQYGLFAVLMVLAVPAAWMHYETILSVVFLWLLYHLRTQQLSVRHVWLFGLSYGLIAFGNQWSFNNRIDYGIITTLGVSYKFYGMVLLLMLIGWQIFQSTANWHTPLVQLGIAVWRWLSNRRTALEINDSTHTQANQTTHGDIGIDGIGASHITCNHPANPRQ
ncbi:MAG: DUF2029 domain-containing protein [Chloroflexia bacterium]|nr:DUF2029 domain-containing protein [Chloroflexia bacterium]